MRELQAGLCVQHAFSCALEHAGQTANPLSSSVKSDFRSVRDYVLRSAGKMPEESYAFKPSPEVRSFARQIAHIADDQYNLCAPARGETRKDPYTHIEDTLSTKAELVPR